MKHETKKIRLFIGIDLPEPVLYQINAIQNAIQRENLFAGKFIPLNQVHITVKFIGDVPENQVHAIDAALKNISLPTMKAKLGNVDVFASGNKIKIIYVHVICKALLEFEHTLETVLLPWVEEEKRDFIGHATIARVKQVKDNRILLHFINQLKYGQIPFEIDKFQLKCSVLSQEGPAYTTITEYKLG